MKSCVTAAALASFLSVGAAHAASFTFSFDIIGQDYIGSGTFDGDLQGDNDTILNMSNLEVTYTTGGNVYENTGNPLDPGAQWSLSGVSADWITFAPQPGGMAIEGSSDVHFGDPAITTFFYDPNQFTISLAAVPLPASLALLIAALGGLGLTAHRRQTA